MPTEISDQDMAITCAYLDLKALIHTLADHKLAPDMQAQAMRTLDDMVDAFPQLQLPATRVTY